MASENATAGAQAGTVIDNLNRIAYADAAAKTAEALLEEHKTKAAGLSSAEAAARAEIYGPNQPVIKKRSSVLIQFLSKFATPLPILLIVIATINMLVDVSNFISSTVIITMAIVSVVVGFAQEYKAGKEAERLQEMVKTTAAVYRDGKAREMNFRHIVPGDIIELSAGDLIPADLRVITCKDLFVSEASLTGEAFPVEKMSAPQVPKGTSISDFSNITFMGSSVLNGTATALVIRTGSATKFGELAKRLASMAVETSFERELKGYTLLIIRIVLVMAAFIFTVNTLLKGNMLEAFLFSLAVAVGLAPEMLPMIVTVNLSKGAVTMAKKEVIVKRLNSIQNFGAMDVLCTDKTGTITLNEVVLEQHVDLDGREDEEVMVMAYINAYHQTGLKNLLDKAILKHEKIAVHQFKKMDEIPFDFQRRIMSVVVEENGEHLLVAKGAPEDIIKRCKYYDIGGKSSHIDEKVQAKYKATYDHLSSQGFRVLSIAFKKFTNDKKGAYGKEDETELVFRGFVAFLDPPKPSARKAIEGLRKLGISMKILTGDNELVTRKICSEVGLEIHGVISGSELDVMTDTELDARVEDTTIGVRLSPTQKERIVRALQRRKHVIGYMGDGINDAPTLKASDVGISVNNAADVAKESADVILLRKSLTVLLDGVVEGRRTFGNIEKYIKMGGSSNFGNMISMMLASAALPFLPMLPVQVLVNNFLYDMSQVAIPWDGVDKEYLAKPRPWNIKAIRNFMILFGPISSVFDIITFAVSWFVFGLTTIAAAPVFHTIWFLESLCTQTFIIHIIRTDKVPFVESRPSKFLVVTTIIIVAAGFAIPYTQLGKGIGFVELQPVHYAAIILIVVAYLITTFFAKKILQEKFEKELAFAAPQSSTAKPAAAPTTQIAAPASAKSTATQVAPAQPAEANGASQKKPATPNDSPSSVATSTAAQKTQPSNKPAASADATAAKVQASAAPARLAAASTEPEAAKAATPAAASAKTSKVAAVTPASASTTSSTLTSTASAAQIAPAAAPSKASSTAASEKKQSESTKKA